MILKIHLSVSARKIVVCGVNSRKFKSVEKNILSRLHSWLTFTHSKINVQQSHHLKDKWNIEENLFFQKCTASYKGIVCYEVFCIGSYIDSY